MTFSKVNPFAIKSEKIILILFIFSFLYSSVLIAKPTIFHNKTNELKINFKHDDGRTGDFDFTETAGSGLGWIDYNNDDKIDLLAINGNIGSHKFYLNLGNDFKDVTSTVLPLNTKGKGMGVCSADVNQDGWVDFLITNYGDDVLYINHQGKTFKSQNLDPKPQTTQWSTSCAFSDLDNDGDVDLYVTRYAEFESSSNKACQTGTAKGYCNPSAYKGKMDGLYINDGNGNFIEEAEKRGIDLGIEDRGFGVIISDYDNDRDMDIYVANDGTSNRLYINNGKGFFTDNGLYSGTAINQNGKAESSMGIALADINQDDKQDLIVTHFSMETNTLYQNFGDGNFSDMTHLFDLNQSSYMSMGWGISFNDINNNGYEDLIVANGHIHDFIKKTDSRQSYAQDNQVFLNHKGKKFVLQDAKFSITGSSKKSSRGLATADWNNDGKIDLAISNIVDKLEVFENIDSNNNNWLGIKLIGNMNNTSAIGAIVTVTSGPMKQRKEIISGGSYMSQSDFRLIFGLGDYKKNVEITIQWPDGKMLKKSINKLNSYHTIRYNEKI